MNDCRLDVSTVYNPDSVSDSELVSAHTFRDISKLAVRLHRQDEANTELQT